MIYDYFETPDGQDIDKKVLATWKPTFLTAVLLGTADIMMRTRPKTHEEVTMRYLYYVTPIMTMGILFALVSNTLAYYREKDDKWNWWWGGVSTGPIMGLWKRSIPWTIHSAIAFGFIAVLKKDSLQNGWIFIPSKECPGKERGTIWSTHFDWTYTKERPRNWCTGDADCSD